MVASLGCALASVAFMLGAIQIPRLALGLRTAGTVLAACASALYILMWCEFYACLSPITTAMAIALAIIWGEALLFLLAGMTVPYRLGALALLPALSTVCLVRARSRLAPEARPQPSDGPLHAPWELIALVSLYAFTEGVCIGVSKTHAEAFTGAANVIAGGGLIALLLLFPRKLDLKVLDRSPLAVLVPLLLLIPFVGGARDTLAAACTAFSSSVFTLAIFLVICDIVHTKAIPAVFLFGLEEAFADIALPLGESLGSAQTAFHWPEAASDVFMAVCIAVTVIALLALFGSGTLEQRLGG